MRFTRSTLAAASKAPTRTACRTGRTTAPPRPAVEPLEDRRLMSAGQFDPSFGYGSGIVRTEVQGTVKKMLLQSDGKAVVLATDGKIARFNGDGSLDVTFARGGSDGDGVLSPVGYRDPTNYLPNRQTFNDIALTAGDKLVVTGTQERPWGKYELLVARFTTGGARDTSFNGTGTFAGMIGPAADNRTESGNAVLVDANGKVLVADRVVIVNGDHDYTTLSWFVRFNANGSRDTSFGQGGIVQTIACRTTQPYYDQDAMTQGPGGKYVLTETWPQGNTFYAIRLANTGATEAFTSVPIGFTGGVAPTVATLAVQSDGKVLVGGSVRGNTFATQHERLPFVARLTPALALDNTFQSGNVRGAVYNAPVGQVRRLLPQADGKAFAVVAAGDFESSVTLSRRRLMPDGSYDILDHDGSTPLFGRFDEGDAAMRNDGRVLIAGQSRGNIAFVRMLNDVGGVTGSVKAGQAGQAGVTVYDDANNNGRFDATEARTLTNAAGNYRLVGLTPGTHNIRQAVPAGFRQSAPTNGGAITVTVAANAVAAGRNFSNTVIAGDRSASLAAAKPAGGAWAAVAAVVGPKSDVLFGLNLIR